MPDPAWVYFVHSFAPERTADTTSTCDYGGPVVAAAERGRVWGTQFHPEKSGPGGSGILANFVAAVRRRRGLMDLYPAIDLRDGGAVRLTQGDFDRQSDYGDPVALAARFAAAGGARGCTWSTSTPPGRADRSTGPRCWPSPRPSTCRSRPAGACAPRPTSPSSSTPAWPGWSSAPPPSTTRAWCAGPPAAFPGRVALGLDYRRTADGRAEVAVRGWEEGSGRTVGELLAEVAGAGLAAVVVTAIERDGMLGGPDLDGLAAVLASTDVPVIASGGVGSVADIVALAALRSVGRRPASRRLRGAITGKALVDGRMTVEEGVAACAPSG